MEVRTVNLLNIKNKELKVSKFNRMLDKIGYHNEKGFLYGFLYLDKEKGLTLRVFGNIDEEKVIEFIKTDQLLKHYETLPTLEYKQLPIHDLNKLNKVVDYFENGGVTRAREEKSINKARNKEYPSFLNVTVIYDDGTSETLFGLGCDYIKKDNEVIVNLVSDSFFDDDLVSGTTLVTEYVKTKDFEGLVLKRIIDEE